jgi:CDP-diacylglycerol--serine O-phosphatidyltransferase
MKLLPNLITMTNLFLGLLAILFIAKLEIDNKVIIVSVLVFLGALADAFDGTVARKYDAVSEFGKQLDSFADIVTFGLAPWLLFYYVFDDVAIYILIFTLLYPMAGVFRLARYNTLKAKDYFVGLPITVAGLLLTCYCLIYYFAVNEENITILNIVGFSLMIILSFLMISGFKVKRITFFKK